MHKGKGLRAAFHDTVILEGQAQEGWAGEEMEKLGRKQGMDCDG